MARRYKQVWQNGNGFSKWEPHPAGAELVQCCGCGLVHEIQYRVRDGVVENRCRELIGETKRLRKKMLREADGIFAGLTK